MAVGTAPRAEIESMAATRPRSSRIDGAIPRTRSRISASAWRAWACPSRISVLAAAGSDSTRSSARPRSMLSITSRCWAPSWRSRSIRCSSLASTSRTADRLCRSDSTSRRSSRLSGVQRRPVTTPRWRTITSCDSEPATHTSRAPATARVSTIGASWPPSGPRNQPGLAPAHRVEPDRRGHERERSRPGGPDDEELDDR